MTALAAQQKLLLKTLSVTTWREYFSLFVSEKKQENSSHSVALTTRKSGLRNSVSSQPQRSFCGFILTAGNLKVVFAITGLSRI